MRRLISNNHFYPLLLLLAITSLVYAKPKMSVIISMIGPQLDHFKQQIKDFEKIEKINIEVINTEHMDEIVSLLNNQKDVALFMIPFGIGWSLVGENRIQPLNSFLTPKELESFSNEFILTWLGKKEGIQYFLPNKYETRIMVYRKSKLFQALDDWNTPDGQENVLKKEVDQLLKNINGFGLPRNYELENSASQWDFYDIFVLGMIWANTAVRDTETRYIGHRGKNYFGTSLRVIDRVLQCGGDSVSILSMDGTAFEDALAWEAIYSKHIYHPRMWEDAWDGQQLWEQFGNESIYMSFLTQLDYFFLHGTNNAKMKGFLHDPSDLGFSVMPRGCSVELDNNGDVLRTGTHKITNGGWWWAIPAEWNNPNLSYKLFLYLSTKERQAKQSRTFGIIPVRSDIVKDPDLLYKSGWISDVFYTSYEQIRINNNNVIPSHLQFNKISKLYNELLFKIIKQSVSRPDSSLIDSSLFQTYTKKAKEILNR